LVNPKYVIGQSKLRHWLKLCFVIGQSASATGEYRVMIGQSAYVTLFLVIGQSADGPLGHDDILHSTMSRDKRLT